MSFKLQIYVGTYTEPILFGTGQILEGKGEGLYLYEMELGGFGPARGSAGAADGVSACGGPASLVWKRTGVANPSFLELSPSRRFLYAVNELKVFEGKASGAVSAFALDSGGAPPRFLNMVPSLGTDPCHIAVDPEGRHAVVTNYMSGSVCVLPILADGSLGEMSDFIQHHGSSLNPARQGGPHAHSAVFGRGGELVFVTDLGTDELVAYAWEGRRGKLTRREASCFKARPGAGPRHLALHPSSPFAYLVNELDSTISVLAYEASRPVFEEIQSIGTLPAGFAGPSSCADLHIGPRGDFLYASNRGHDSIAAFRIDPGTGRLEALGHYSSGGRTPRNFDIDPSGSLLFAANQDTDNIVVFRIDPESGALEPSGEEIEVPTPVCVRIYEAP